MDVVDLPLGIIQYEARTSNFLWVSRHWKENIRLAFGMSFVKSWDKPEYAELLPQNFTSLIVIAWFIIKLDVCSCYLCVLS